jgi:hypothetical protein
MLYTTINALKTRLWIANDNTESDSKLSLIIERATKLIDSELGESLQVRQVVERVNWNWNRRIFLKNKPVPWWINYIRYKDTNQNLPLDYVDWYVLYLEYSVFNWHKNIEVSYNVWYESIPNDIEEICLDLCTILSDQQGITGSNSEKLIDKNIKTQKLWELSITYFGENEKTTQTSFETLNPAKHVQKVLNKYKPFTWLHY